MDRGSRHCTGGVIKTIHKKRKCKKEKWLFEEALQIAEKRREAKGKGNKERYTQLNAVLQRIARRDKRKKKKPSSVINAKKQKKTIKWERLETTSRKSEIPSQVGPRKHHYEQS